MKIFRTWVRQFLKKEDGASVVEYSVLIALIIAVTIIAIAVLGNWVLSGFEDFDNQLNSAGVNTT